MLASHQTDVYNKHPTNAGAFKKMFGRHSFLIYTVLKCLLKSSWSFDI